MLLTACLLIGMLGAADPGAGVDMQNTLVIKPNAVVNTQIAQQNLLQLINDERTKAGLKQVHLDSDLSQAALDHAQLMSRRGKLSHQFENEPALLQRLATHNVRVDVASENVVYDISAQGAHDAFLASPRHAQNMLNPAYDAVGIAVVNHDGILFVVEDFVHRIASEKDDEIALKIAEQVAKLRDQTGLPSLAVVSDPRLQAMLEDMATRETPDGHAPLTLTGVRAAASYATTTPEKIPASVASIASSRRASACAVGVHFARTPHYPSGLFWISVLMIDQDTSLAKN